MSSPTRWAGVPLTDRRAERRAQLIEAAFRLFGDGGEAAVAVRSVCRECGLNTRYFYESFADTDDLLGAVYDQVSAQLGVQVEAAITASGDSLRDRTRAGIAAVLGFSSADPRRGRILFTDARANPVLAARRTATQDLLREGVLTEGWRLNPGSDPVAAQVGPPCTPARWPSWPNSGWRATSASDLDAVVATVRGPAVGVEAGRLRAAGSRAGRLGGSVEVPSYARQCR